MSVRSAMVSSTEPETLWITLGNFFVTRFSLIVLFFLSLFSFLYFVFFLLLFFVLFQHYFSSFFIISNFIWNFQCKKYDMNLKLSLRWLFLSQNHLRQIWQIVEVCCDVQGACQHDYIELLQNAGLIENTYQKDRTIDIRLHFPTNVTTLQLYLGWSLLISIYYN